MIKKFNNKGYKRYKNKMMIYMYRNKNRNQLFKNVLCKNKIIL